MSLFKSLNPDYTKFKYNHYRDNYNSAILNDSFSLTNEEKAFCDEIIKISKKAIYFDFAFPSNFLDLYEKKHRKGIAEKDIQVIVTSVCNYLRLDNKFLKIKIFTLNKFFKGYLGYFIEKGNIGGEIGISISPLYDISIVLSIIIHELMHYFMHVFNINAPNDLDEYFTDFLAVYLGLGKYMINGYRRITIIDQNFMPGFKELAIGYLSDRQLAYIERHYNF